LEWSEQGVEGGFRFLNRVWRLAAVTIDHIKDVPPYNGNPDKLEDSLRELYRKTHKTIQRVTRDIENRFHFNTAISAVMELFNTVNSLEMQEGHDEQHSVVRFALESLTLLLAPIVPHFAEELWEALGHQSSVLLASWPQYRKDALEEDELLIVVQVNGKLRSRFMVSTDTGDETIKERALTDKRIQKFISGKAIRKVIVVKNKLVTIVV